MTKRLTAEEHADRRYLLEKHSSASGCVWSYPMLRALDNGVKGGKWYCLKDKICRQQTVRFAYNKVAKNKGGCGVDKETIKMFKANLDANCEHLSRSLDSSSFQPLPVKRVYIDKPGSKEKRPLGIPTVRQRVVESAIKFALEPIFETQFLDCNYGFRPNRSAKDALREVNKNLSEGYSFAIDADIKGYFDTINHDLLMSFVEEHIADKWVLEYLKKFLSNDIMDSVKHWKPTQGSPQGSVLSPLLSNIYLHRLDKRMVEEGFRLIRYADDFVVMCKSMSNAQRGLSVIKDMMIELKLTLHPTKTKVVEVTDDDGFEFLGYLFLKSRRTPRNKSVSSLKEKIKSKTRRSQGRSIVKTIEALNPILKGWYEYFKHIKRSDIFIRLDKFIRRRLRSILAKFKKKKGSHRRSDHLKYKNAYFHTRGLFSLHNSHKEDVILARGNL